MIIWLPTHVLMHIELSMQGSAEVIFWQPGIALAASQHATVL